MKASQLRPIFRYLTANLDGFAFKGRMVFAIPVDHILRAFLAEPSGFDADGFYLWAFAIPLYIPTDHISFSFGDRIYHDGLQWWNRNDPNLNEKLLQSIQADGLSLLEATSSPQKMIDFVVARFVSENPYHRQALAYSLAAAEDYVRSREELNALIEMLDPDVDWQVEMKLRAMRLRDAIDTDPRVAQELLAGWEAESRHNLKIDEP